MHDLLFYSLWGGLYILCAVLGFIPNPTGVMRVIMTLLSVLFFVPPAVILVRSRKTEDRKTARRIRNLSILSLALTLVVLVLNFLSVGSAQWVGNVLYAFLILVSSPMICSQFWFLSLFGWACLLFGSISLLKKK